MKGVVLGGHDLVTSAGGGSNGDVIGDGRTDAGNKRAIREIEIVDGKSKIGQRIVDILKTGFDLKAAIAIKTGSDLADRVGELVVGRTFIAGGHVEITPVDDVGRGFEMLGQNFGIPKFGKFQETNSKKQTRSNDQ